MPTLSRPDSFNVSFFDEEKARRNLNRFGEYIIGYARLSFDEDGEGYLFVISMFGTKMTRKNVVRTGVFSANLVSTDMLPLMDYFGSKHAKDGTKNDLSYTVVRGEALDVPVLDESRFVYECEVTRTVETGDSATFFCHIRNIQIDERLTCEDTFDVDLTVLDPVIYSGRYHSIGKMLGKIGDFINSPREKT